MLILTLNCWSYSIRYQLFDWDNHAVLAHGEVERITVGDTTITHTATNGTSYRRGVECPDHRAGIAAIMAALTDPGSPAISSLHAITAIGHRVVHGGDTFTHSTLVDDEVLDAIREAQQLAPLHNGPNIAGIEAARDLFPHIPHVAIFDTAFHQTMPEHAYIYPLPLEWYTRHGVRRYGFHGPSHLYLSRRAALLLSKRPIECNLVTIHLGKGVSLCAIKNGCSIDTSMGLTPLEGAVMETRCGDIDPGIPPFMMEEGNLTARAMDNILNQKSGMAGITGNVTDRHQLRERATDGDERCRLALEMESYRLRKYIGAYIAALGRPDAVVFTAGGGETEWQLREKVLQGLECFGITLDSDRNRAAVGEEGEWCISRNDSAVRVLVIPTNEELVFTEDVAAIIAGHHPDPLSYDYRFARPAAGGGD
ncbi:acetate/propionate family kinase [Geomobilimonas luticola]|uniref:Acetate kinase n=1 Tax=Geomobilimonas luticola TaxID=1114878 RepID=A0ABS5SGS5_9BACT|nr:acetate kinase [Geomobilimonas luticola]